jgi:hypothetical protein
MTIRERVYRWLVNRYGPLPDPYRFGAISVGVGVGGRPLPKVSAALEATIHFIEDVRRPQNLLIRLLAPPTPLPDPVLVTQQILDHLEQERRAQTELLAASGDHRREVDAEGLR